MSVLLRLVLTLILLGMAVWGALALYYQGPAQAIWLHTLISIWSIISLFFVISIWRKHYLMNFGYFLLMFFMLLLWWSSIKPSNERDWAEEVQHMASGELNGNLVTINNVRNFTWRSETDYTPRWETRHYDLSQLNSIDLVTSNWGITAISHILVTFGFNDGQFLTFTVEIRKTKTQSFDSIAGFFKAYELSIIASDEHDAVGVRPNIRGEQVHLYRLNMPQAAMQQLFTAYIEKANQLLETPEFYHTVTANCTTIVFDMMQHISHELPLDYRLLLTGYLPNYVQAQQGFYQPNVSLDELTSKGLINNRSKAAANSHNYSQAIRQGVPGWEKP